MRISDWSSDVCSSDLTVVATDLRGYGDSSKPAGGGDHSAYSFRTMREDSFEVMRQLGFERFAVDGHDRGARIGFRTSLARPEAIERPDRQSAGLGKWVSVRAVLGGRLFMKYKTKKLPLTF